MVERCDRYDPGKFRVLFVSHDLPDIRQLKGMESAIILSLDPDDTQKAIGLFIDLKLVEINEKFHLRKVDLRDAKSKTMSRSDGTSPRAPSPFRTMLFVALMTLKGCSYMRRSSWKIF